MVLIRNRNKLIRRSSGQLLHDENHEPGASSNSQKSSHNKKESQNNIMIKVIISTAEQDNPGFHNLDNVTNNESIVDRPITPTTKLHAMEAMESCREGTDYRKPCLQTPAIATTANTANRFTDAQRGRTLCHHTLIQPTPSQEFAHLAKLRGHEIVRAFSSQMSLQSLPEEGCDHEETILQLDLKHMQSCDKDAGNAPRKNSSLSLQSLPEEGCDHEEAFVQLDLKHMQSCDKDAGNAPRKNSSSDTCSTKESSVSDCSISRLSIAGSIEGDDFRALSPMTMLFVPGQGCVPEVNVKNTAVPEPNGSAEFNLPLFSYCQPCEMEPHSPSHRFVICADTQFGIATNNENWQAEMEYSIGAVDLINKIDPQPSFVCVCGDLVDMEFSFEKKKGSKSKFPSTLFDGESGIASREVCDFIQDEQNADFKRIWAGLDPSIALVCLCGNHDVGNRPTPRSISRFRSAFGDEYLAFWTNGSYNIVLNNVLYNDPSGAERIFKSQHRWLENRLQYARHHQATSIFVFSHHPWFLYDEFEDPQNLTGYSPYPVEWRSENGESFPDSYFSMPKKYRAMALKLFRQYDVKACFSGHFHQNLISKTSWGMDMIVTASLSVIFDSTGNKNSKANESLEEEGLDLLAYQRERRRKMTYESEEAMMNDSASDEEMSAEPNCRGIRVVDVQSDSGFRHFFVPL